VIPIVRPLFASWHEIAAQLRARRNVALFMDFDGTLAAIQPRPEMVHLTPGLRRTLAALARNPRLRMWVISARRRADIRARVRLPGLIYQGLYGWERSFPPSPRGAVARVKDVLAATLPRHPAVWIEDKRYAVAVHYRGAPESIRRIATERVRGATEPWSSQLRITPGKCVREVVPRGLDKGAAVRRELAALDRTVLPIYLGDDFSDEAAFAAVASRGVGIQVGGRAPTRAHYRLEGQERVHYFLEKLRTELA
jgi:trehalose-phosphatase